MKNDPIKKMIEGAVKKYFPNEIDRSDAERLIEDIVQIVSKYYVKKEDLPTVEEILTILDSFAGDWSNDGVFSIIERDFKEVAKVIVKRIGKEVKMKKYKYRIHFDGLNPLIEKIQNRPSKRRRTRTLRTYENKLRKLKSFYNRLTKRKGKFFEKYPTFEKFLEKINLKKPEGGG